MSNVQTYPITVRSRAAVSRPGFRKTPPVVTISQDIDADEPELVIVESSATAKRIIRALEKTFNLARSTA